METFNFPFHRLSFDYPENQFRVTLGRGWSFAAAPAGKDQRIFKLNFEGMSYFTAPLLVNAQTNPYGVSSTIEPTRNMRTLELFYQNHKLHKDFWYPHPVEGQIRVRFNRPLSVPEVEKGGFGVVSPFQLELIEIPS